MEKNKLELVDEFGELKFPSQVLKNFLGLVTHKKSSFENMIPKKILNFLKKNKISFEIISHKKVYTAFDKVRTLKNSPQSVAKVVFLKAKNKIFAFVLSASQKLDLKKAKKFLKEKEVKIASEKIIQNKIKGFKLGAIPPFEEILKIPVFFEKKLLKLKEVILPAGDWQSSLKLKKEELKKIVKKERIGDFFQKKGE